MTIKTLQQKQAQVGRIRIGHQVPTGKGRMRPEKLDRFRFTTPSRALADAVAARYGGTVTEWAPEGRAKEWEVVSDARALPVLVPPRPVSQFYEMWSGAGCQRRCDGETEQLSGEACKCPLDTVERVDLAAKGQACKATTRLNVMLPEIPGIGVWRLDSHGYYAAIELPQTAEFLGAVTEKNGYIKATLALEARVVAAIGGGATAVGAPDRPAITAAPGRSQAEYRTLADDATTEPELVALYEQARTDGVWDDGLASYFKARKAAIAASAAADPAGEDDAASLYARCVYAASEQPDGYDLAAEFADHAGKPIEDASAQDLAAFLTTMPAAVAS